MKILIIKIGALGDVLRTIVILEGLVEKFVNPIIHWLTSETAKPLLENNPYVDKLFFKEQPNEEIFNNSYDLVISLEEDKKVLELIDRLKYKNLFGIYLDGEKIRYAPESSMWYDMSLISKFGKNVADELKKANVFSYPELLYRMLDLPWKSQRYRIFLVKKDIHYANVLKDMLHGRPTIGIVIGSGGRWPMKSLPADKQVELIQGLNKEYGEKINILLLTGPSSFELSNANEIKKKCPYVITHDIQELHEFIGITTLCNLLISPDTLSMHIGIALYKHVIAYFTVTSASEIELYTGKKIIAKHKDYCSYTPENLARPNITDAININEIVAAVTSILPVELC